MPSRAALLLLRAAAALLLLHPAAAAILAQRILSYRTPSAWFGSSAIALQAAADPILLASTWVYPPTEILGFRPATHNSTPAYTEDTTRDLQYQTLYVAAPGATLASSPPRIDALAFWNRKPHGTDGDCILLGFHSATGPDLSLRPSATTWHYNLSSDCSNVNLATPWTRFALSDDGALAVAWVQGAAGNLTLFALHAQTGALAWARAVPCGTPAQCQYFLAYGVDVSGDGRFITYDEGMAGDGSAHRLHVLEAATGAARCAPLLSPSAIPAHLSPAGDYALTWEDDSASGSPASGAFATWRWSPGAQAYQRTPGGLGRPPLDSHGNGWTLAQYAFSQDAAGQVYVGVVWYDSTLLGPSIAALYNASSPGAGPLSAAHTEPLPGSDYANAGAVIDCAGALCAAGFFTQAVGGPQPTLVLLAAGGHAVYNYTTPGSVDAVSVAHAAGEAEYYVLASGCASVGVCTVPGGDLVGLRVTLSA